ncbi:major facilitator superfamily transporter [Rhizoctonia solani]|uniref:Major facilitator superfamily transporter n=1 Tax=Rhizoctonia solani TaxID=456999 RepID=A0A8H8PAG7_9AGAM|nr:major facilitator superfamily transporter [Rhizoctonia solani]QRW26721.1 major facilitator superfamily transporter [Rhizoctonia solani]
MDVQKVESSAPSSVSVETVNDSPTAVITDLEKGAVAVAPSEESNLDTEKAPGPVVTKHENGLTDQTFYLPRRKIITIFLACASTEIVALIDEKAVAAALSIISSELVAGSKISWVASAYFLQNEYRMYPLYGRISDIYSRKNVLYTLITIFFFGSLAASLAQTVVQLIIFRAITGIGGGGLILVGQLIVGDVVTVRERGKYQGILGAFVALSNGIGPLIGAAYSQKVSWRWIFRMNMPLAVFASVCVYFFMPLKKVHGTAIDKLKKVDFIGSLLVLIGTGAIILGLTWGGVVISIGFVIWEWKFAELPLIPMYIFRYKVVVGAALTHFVNGYGMYVQIFYLPTFYQLAYGYSAIRSASLLLPVVLFQTLFSTLGGAMVSWKGRFRELLLSGTTSWFSIFAGVGIGQTLQPSLVAVQAAVERKDMAVTTTARSFLHNLGGVVGLTISGSIINNVLSNHIVKVLGPSLSDEARKAILNDPISARHTLDAETLAIVIDGYRLGFRTLFIVCASLTAFAFFTTLFLIPHISLRRDDDKALKAQAKEELERRKEAKTAGR